MNVKNPIIETCRKSGKNCLKFTFGARITAREAAEAIVEWQKAFQSDENEPMTLIWDCRDMKAYESQARTQWTHALKKMKPQIEAIWLITNSPFIKMGASVMGMLSSLEINIVSDEREIVA